MGDPFLRTTGWCLSAGGVLLAAINIILTPMLPRDVPFAVTAASTVFLWRQSASALCAFLLLLGCIGVYLQHRTQAGRFGAAAFVLAFFGTAALLGWEWVDIFVLRELALRAPAALQTLEGAKGVTLYDLGAAIPMVAFSLGWLALAASIIRTTPAARRAAWLVVAGFFAIPILGAMLSMWGLAAGNVVLGAGLFLLGREVTGTA